MALFAAGSADTNKTCLVEEAGKWRPSYDKKIRYRRANYDQICYPIEGGLADFVEQLLLSETQFLERNRPYTFICLSNPTQTRQPVFGTTSCVQYLFNGSMRRATSAPDVE